MRIGYKIRKSGTEKNPWIIAVIYDIDGWPGRSLTNQGLNDPQFTREATEAEKEDWKKNRSMRCFYCKYTNIQGFIEDEELSKVPKEFIEKVLLFHNQLQITRR